MLKGTARTTRIASQMQRSLAVLLRGVRDPRVGNVTVTAVEVAGDLSFARVHVLPFAGDGPADELLEGLRSASGFLRGALARELKLRHMPRLEFRLDVAIANALRLTGLIDGAVASDRARGAHDAGSADDSAAVGHAVDDAGGKDGT